jgi:hypothetical protein
MERPLKTVGLIFAAAICAVLVACPSRAQEDAQSADSDRDARSSGDPDAAKNDPRAKDAGAVEVSARAGLNTRGNPDASRKSANERATGTLGKTPGNKGVPLDHGINLVTPDEGYGGRRRAIRKPFIANVPKKPAGPSAVTITHPQVARPRGESAVMRNAVGTVVPSGNAGGPQSGRGIAKGGEGRTAIGSSPTGVGLNFPRPTIRQGTGATVNAAAINGTSIGHIAYGPSSIGGPAKDRSGGRRMFRP